MRLPTLTSSLVVLPLALAAVACRGGPPPPPSPVAAAPPRPAIETPLEAATAHRTRESSGIVVATLADRTILLLADADDHAIRAFDAQTLEPLASTELDEEPRDLLLANDGSLFVTLPEVSTLLRLRAAADDGSLHESERTKTSAEPLAMALPPEEDRVLVVTGASHRLEAFDAQTLARRSTIEVGREPRAVVVTSDGARALVSHAASEELLVVDLLGAEPRIAARTPLGIPPWFSYGPSPPPRSARHAYAMVRTRTSAGERFLVPVAQEATSGASPSGYGADDAVALATRPSGEDDFCGYSRAQFSTTGKSNFDMRTVRPDGSLPARTEGRLLLRTECLLPRAAITAADLVLVACEGDSEVVGVSTQATGWPTIMRRWSVGRGPSAIARVPATNRFVVWARFSRTLSLVDLGASPAPLASRDLPRSRARDPLEVAGREIFHRNGDRRISRDGVACASCHPDGRDDGLVWAGPLGHRHSLTLAGNARRDGPFGWGAEHATLEQHVSETIRRLGGQRLPREELAALAAYLRTMKPLPQRGEGAIDPLVTSGRQVFHSDRAACATCHVEPGRLADGEPHDVGSGGVFLTPSLAGAGARTTFFHDGRFSNVEDLLAHAPRMGGAALLSPTERTALAAFVKAL